MRTPAIRTVLIYPLIFILTAAAAVFLRLYPLRHYASDQALDKATIYVTQTANRSVRDALNASLPAGLPPAGRKRLLSRELNALLQRDRQQVRQTIYKVARQLDLRHPPEHRFPWLLASDSFYYYDLTRTLQTTGRISGSIKGSKYFHPKMNAPDGYWEPLTLHPFIGLSLHRLFNTFMPEVPLMVSVSWTPLVMALAALLLFLITAARLNMSPWSSAAASVCLVCAEVFLKRSTLGWYDNDPYNVVFPMLLMLILAVTLRARTPRRTVAGGIALASALSLYSLFWQGWVFAACVLAAALSACVIDRHVMLRHRIPSAARTAALSAGQPVWLLASFLIAGLAEISLIFGPRELVILFQEGWQALRGFFNSGLPVWPDNYITVGELKRSSLPELLRLTGGWPMAIGAVAGLISSVIRILRRPASKTRSFRICVMIFAAAAVILSLGAQRFTLLAVTPLTFLFLFAAEDLIRWIRPRIQPSTTPLNRLFPVTLILALIGFSAVMIRQMDNRMPALINRIYNDTWDEAMRFLKNETPPDAIVDTWWSPGHFIKAMAQRRVVFDGASISSRQSYWLARALMAANEPLALQNLRLLNNGGAKTVDLLREVGLRDSGSAQLIETLMTLPQTEALDLAGRILPEKTAREVIRRTHSTPAPACLMITRDMIEDLVIYPLIAGWNFSRVEEINRNPVLRAQIPPARQKKNYINFLWTLAGGQPRISGILNTLDVNAQTGVISFTQGLSCDLTRRICRIDSEIYGRDSIPAELIFSDGNQIIIQPQANANLSYSVVVGQRHGHHEALLADRDIARSFLVRLYFFGDTGLDHIRRVHQSRDATGQLQIDLFEIRSEDES